MPINLCSYRLELHNFCLSSDCQADSLGTKKVLSMYVQNFWKVSKSRWQKNAVAF